jgi:stringent starvation protein B
MTDKIFHHVAHEHINNEVEITTLQGNFTGRIEEIGKDFIILHSRGRGFPMNIAIRIEAIVAIFRIEAMPRGPFGFNLGGAQVEAEEHHESH